MRMIAVLGLLGISAALSLSAIAEDGEPKHSIKECMKTCFKGPLVKKVAGGEASDEEKAKLHEMMVSMAKATPKKGDAESWKMKTEALVKAAKAAVEGEAGAAEALKKAANCKACHSVHK
ncbi:hypothetical protein Poly24_36360 [Rosistilla carotiformis]|uniref:Cytochrome C n=1 Tax=Rosistilla carotiformis TaxID=2528017 RepID=A0A518JWJ7_9BACT|nr:hypothetical protein [Rosistilla carotiformis]QDV69918.1 hypothetical protein Poly24_36360 [Rosistilla carotiformis]